MHDVCANIGSNSFYLIAFIFVYKNTGVLLNVTIGLLITKLSNESIFIDTCFNNNNRSHCHY